MNDYLIRATAADGMVRAFACTSAHLVETARKLHDTSPVATAALGRLMSGAVMMGCMMKSPEDLLTLQVKGDGPLGGIVVTADSLGHVKGYVYEPHVLLPANSRGKLDVGGAVGRGTLMVSRDLGLKEPYNGSCPLFSGEIAEDLTSYFVQSEQVPSSVGLGVLMEKNNTVRQAGGFIIQLMPGASDEIIDQLEQRLAKTRSVTTMLDEGMTPEDILSSFLGDMDLSVSGKMEIGWYCGCSRQRFAAALASIGKKDLEEMISEGRPVEAKCHF